MNFNEVLKAIGSNLQLHAKLVNTFSLMEYIGARKIIKSQKEFDISETLLSHLSEEIRHATILKRLALKMSHGNLNSYSPEHILGSNAAQNYMQTVDRASVTLLNCSDPWKNYLYTTWLIEERALRIYPIYEELLSQLKYPGHFKGILKDEERHLNFILQETSEDFKLTDKKRIDLLNLEEIAFEIFCKSIFENNSS